MTKADRMRSDIVMDFNPHPRIEDDDFKDTVLHALDNFNPHPRIEDDGFDIVIYFQNTKISIHILA